MVQSHNGILFRKENEYTVTTDIRTDKAHKPNDEQKKADIEENTCFDYTDIKFTTKINLCPQKYGQ